MAGAKNSSTKSSDKFLEKINESEYTCKICNKKARSTTFVIKTMVPNKLMMVNQCNACNVTDVVEENCTTLKYGVKITCDFEDGGMENLRRMMFLDSKTTVTLYKNKKVLVDYSTAVSSVDSIEGVLMKIKETVGNCGKESVIKEIGEILKGAPFSIEFKDEGGYTKVCPAGTEYTEVQSRDPEELSDGKVKYEKFTKSA